MKTTKKAVVLLSGGIDSTTCLAMAIDKYGADDVLALSLYYGQKHMKELDCAEKIAQHYGVVHIVQKVEDVYRFSDCSLLKGREDVTEGEYAEQLKNGTFNTYVPFRNGLFLSYATVIAVSVGAEVIYYGAHADDAAGNAYADCSYPFVYAMNEAIGIGTYQKVRLNVPLVAMNKAHVVQTGLALKAPYHLTWSCYKGDSKPCGKCGTCIDRQKAFEANGVSDPIL